MNGRQDIKGLDENGYRMLSGIRKWGGKLGEELMDHHSVDGEWRRLVIMNLLHISTAFKEI